MSGFFAVFCVCNFGRCYTPVRFKPARFKPDRLFVDNRLIPLPNLDSAKFIKFHLPVKLSYLLDATFRAERKFS